MTLFKNIIAKEVPASKREIEFYFLEDERVHGMELISYEVNLDRKGTCFDEGCTGQNGYAHYDIIAVFE